ncbi:acyltransferase family protein [Hyalangium rubrum]|uniref:Acyltransferase n=1 Tax=Hyalangium rubrum TaxID=3103134 RepID=A0ABU5GVT9_9BACT|nr:acyltransferase [Hyalangium sp. s54d21]MDY7225308.1 acyltransferase [Hyalangium sp. s54d21]
MRDNREDIQRLSSDLYSMRGIGILLVVVVHVLGVDATHGVRKLFAADRTDLRVVVELLHSFNMAVMLMGSGVAVAAFGRADLSLFDFMRKKVNKLLVPMLVWAPVLFLMQELTRGAVHGREGWLSVLLRMPTTWFPAYSIFWFVHALVGCTLMAWLFRKYAASALGRWSGAVYFGLAVLLHLLAIPWSDSSNVGGYVEMILSWNRFFGLGLLVYPLLPAVRQAIARWPVALQALLPTAFFALIVLIYAVFPEELYPVVCGLNGPLGFGMLFSLIVFLRQRVSEGGAAWKEAWSRLVFTGSISMTLYLFHIYFVSGMRIALERLHPGMPLAVHFVLGCLAGCVGPWLLFQAFKGLPLFHWSVGLTLRVPRVRAPEGQPAEGLAQTP